ncbi:Fur family transcriptional regulator [Chloroflexota bacterium]
MSCSKVLKLKGVRFTPQRRLIMECIHDKQSHLTADEIIRFVDARAPGVNKSTVYRTLDLLEEAGCVLKSELDGHYIYHHTEEGHHHHLICRKCERSIDCEEDLFISIEEKLESEYGFRADFKHIVISGLCADCRK